MLEASEDKLEFVDGMIYAMSGGTPEHARITMAFGAELRAALRGSCRVYGSDLKIRIDATNRATFADVTAVCGPLQTSPSDRLACTNPTLIVEVLSPSTEASDRGEKWHAYRRLPSLQLYVLAAQDQPRIEVFARQGTGWSLHVYGPGEHLELTIGPGITLSVDAIYAE